MPLDSPEWRKRDATDLLAADDVLPDLLAWRREGLETALVTLIHIDGTTPRPLGAQMAVAEDGRYTGYLSGGCLEKAVATEAQRAIREKRSRIVRYGKGSPYFDIKLPCGSGLDLFIDQALDDGMLYAAARLRRARRAFWLEIDVALASTRIVTAGAPGVPRHARDGNLFRRAYVPSVKVLLVGGGPLVVAVAHLISSCGFEIDVATPDEATLRDLTSVQIPGRTFVEATAAVPETLDSYSAAILTFHEHDWEAPILAEILRSRCFYIGALGSKTVHAARQQHLVQLGFEPAEIARVRGPIGLVPGARGRATLAVGILAELTAEAKAAGLIP
jgi:xanthine dehydrogenase accessory factor